MECALKPLHLSLLSFVTVWIMEIHKIIKMLRPLNLSDFVKYKKKKYFKTPYLHWLWFSFIFGSAGLLKTPPESHLLKSYNISLGEKIERIPWPSKKTKQKLMHCWAELSSEGSILFVKSCFLLQMSERTKWRITNTCLETKIEKDPGF